MRHRGPREMFVGLNLRLLSWTNRDSHSCIFADTYIHNTYMWLSKEHVLTQRPHSSDDSALWCQLLFSESLERDFCAISSCVGGRPDRASLCSTPSFLRRHGQSSLDWMVSFFKGKLPDRRGSVRTRSLWPGRRSRKVNAVFPEEKHHRPSWGDLASQFLTGEDGSLSKWRRWGWGVQRCL